MMWDKFRNSNGSINLIEAYESEHGAANEAVIDYFTKIELLCLIVSRQAAAIAITTAADIHSDS